MALVLLIGLLDYLTGGEISFSIFFADSLSGHQYSNVLIPLWNTLVRLGFFLVVLITLDRLQIAMMQARQLARIDPLTGVSNRREFYEPADRELQRARRFHRPLAVAIFDLTTSKRSMIRLGMKLVMRFSGSSALPSTIMSVPLIFSPGWVVMSSH